MRTTRSKEIVKYIYITVEKRVKFIGRLLRYLGKILGMRSRGKPKKRYYEDIKHRLQFDNYWDMKGDALDWR